MATVVAMPKLGLTMKHGTLVKWMVDEGAVVKAGAEVAEIMTEKITSTVETTTDGTVLKIVVAKGVKVPVGTALAYVGEPGEDISGLLAQDGGAASEAVAERAAPAATAPRGREQVAPADGSRVPVSPRARSLAAEKGVDLSAVVGTGPGGRVTKQDILDAAERGVGAQPARPVRRQIEYAGMRRMIGEHMATSWAVAPTVTHHVRADASALLRFREALNRGRPERARISVTAVLTKAVAAALERHPGLNATLEGDTISVWEDINIGVAMALPEGLIVPVIRNAETKGFTQIAAEIADYAQASQALQPRPRRGDRRYVHRHQRGAVRLRGLVHADHQPARIGASSGSAASSTKSWPSTARRACGRPWASRCPSTTGWSTELRPPSSSARSWT